MSSDWRVLVLVCLFSLHYFLHLVVLLGMSDHRLVVVDDVVLPLLSYQCSFGCNSSFTIPRYDVEFCLVCISFQARIDFMRSFSLLFVCRSIFIEFLGHHLQRHRAWKT